MEAGFNGNTLAVFTALAPCGCICYVLLAAYAVLASSRDDAVRARFDTLTFVPVAVVWVGFIASATHLGTPANALYVVTGVGRSPLSNEVAATVAFLFFAGVCWLYTFRIGYAHPVAGALMGCACASAVASVAFMSMAYGIPTVPSWDSWHTSANLVLTGVFSGASLAVCMVRAVDPRARRWTWTLIALSGAALAAGSGVMLMQSDWLAGVTNNAGTALEGSPGYARLVGVHALIGACGLMLQMFSLLQRFASLLRSQAFCLIGFAAVLAAALLVRFPFYDLYLSIGF